MDRTDAANLKGQNALMLISTQNGSDANELQIALLEADSKAEVDAQNEYGETALIVAGAEG